jgi:hypothetical protein
MTTAEMKAIKQHLLRIWDNLYRLSRPGGASPRVRAQMQVDILKMIKDIEDDLDLQMNKDLAEAEIQKIKMNVDTTLALKKAGLPSNGLD